MDLTNRFAVGPNAFLARLRGGLPCLVLPGHEYCEHWIMKRRHQGRSSNRTQWRSSPSSRNIAIYHENYPTYEIVQRRVVVTSHPSPEVVHQWCYHVGRIKRKARMDRGGFPICNACMERLNAARPDHVGAFAQIKVPAIHPATE